MQCRHRPHSPGSGASFTDPLRCMVASPKTATYFGIERTRSPAPGKDVFLAVVQPDMREVQPVVVDA